MAQGNAQAAIREIAPLSITACVIVKNEAKNLPRWLKCVKQLTDDLVVVDTGSTDNTVAIAEAGGAKIYQFPWIGDFAAAKNYTLEKAGGTWIVFLDADEYFSDQDCPQVLELIRESHSTPEILGFIFPVICIDQDNNGAFLNAFPQIRVFRNQPTLRYVGKVHEHLINSQRDRDYRMEALNHRIYHTGYSTSVIEGKLKRNLAILLAQEGEKHSDHYGYMAECYYGLGEYELALACIEKVIDLNDDAYRSRDNRVYAIRLECLSKLDRSDGEILAALRDTELIYPDRPEFVAIVADHFWRKRDYLRTKKYAEKCLDSCRRHSAKAVTEANIMLSDMTGRAEYICLGRLGVLAAWQGDKEKALDLLVRALKQEKYDAYFLGHLLRLLKERDAVTVISLLNNIYDKAEDAKFLLPTLKINRRYQEMLYYAKQGDIPLPEYESYLYGGRLDAAGAWLLDDMDSVTALGMALKTYCQLPEDIFDRLLPQPKEKWEQNVNPKRMERLAEWLAS